QLRADHQIVLALLDLGEAVAQLRVRAHVGAENNGPGLGEASGDLLGDALDPRPDRDQRILDPALRADFRPPLLVPAMMAHQHAAEAVLDQPRRAVRTLVLVAA